MTAAAHRLRLLVAIAACLAAPAARAQPAAAGAEDQKRLDAVLACRAKADEKRAAAGADALGEAARAMAECQRLALDALKAPPQPLALEPFAKAANDEIDAARRRAAAAQRKALTAPKGPQADAAADDAAKAEDQVTNARYKNGAELIGKMSGSAGTVLLVTHALHLESLLNQATDVWRDQDFRNTWDQVQSWGTTIGTLVAAVGAAYGAGGSADSSQRKDGIWTLAGGVGIAGLAQLGGNLLGADKGDKIKKKLEFIELTRTAYDDLSLRIDLVRSYEQTNKEFLADLSAFQARYLKLDDWKQPDDGPNVPEAELKRRAILELGVRVERFTAVLNQLPTLLNNYSVLVEKYSKSTNPQVQADMAQVKEVFTAAKENYDARVKDFLSQQKLILDIFGR